MYRACTCISKLNPVGLSLILMHSAFNVCFLLIRVGEFTPNGFSECRVPALLW